MKNIDIEQTEKKKKFTVTMDREMPYEDAEKVIMGALRSAGMIGHCGGIS